MCVTNDDEIAYRLQLIRNHGEAVVGPAKYENISNIAGFNYRMTEIQAAIAREQLKKLEHLNNIRLKFVEKIVEGIKDVTFLNPLLPQDNCIATYYILPISYDEGIAGEKRDNFVKALNAEGALFYQGYTPPLYLQPLYQRKPSSSRLPFQCSSK